MGSEHRLIATELVALLNQTEYDAETKVAKIQGGSIWSTVFSTLQEYGMAVTGGRTSTVGVGGFLLGGGNNFWSGEKGLGCDTVVNYEIVLTNGYVAVPHRIEPSTSSAALTQRQGHR